MDKDKFWIEYSGNEEIGYRVGIKDETRISDVGQLIANTLYSIGGKEALDIAATITIMMFDSFINEENSRKEKQGESTIKDSKMIDINEWIREHRK